MKGKRMEGKERRGKVREMRRIEGQDQSSPSITLEKKFFPPLINPGIKSHPARSRKNKIKDLERKREGSQCKMSREEEEKVNQNECHLDFNSGRGEREESGEGKKRYRRGNRREKEEKRIISNEGEYHSSQTRRDHGIKFGWFELRRRERRRRE